MKVGYIKEMKYYPLEEQQELLLSSGCTKIYDESRLDIYDLLGTLNAEDMIVITRLSICATQTKDLHQFLSQLQAKEIKLEVVQQETPSIEVLTGFLELILTFQKDLQYQRQAVGISKAKRKGIRFGRPIKMKQANVIKAIRFKNNGYTSKEVANRFNVGKSTLLRYIAEFRKSA